MARAFLSDRLERICGESQTIDGSRLMTHEERIEGYGWLAEREARAILAETEPDTLDASHIAVNALHWSDCTPREASYRFMLADALRAFVEA